MQVALFFKAFVSRGTVMEFNFAGLQRTSAERKQFIRTNPLKLQMSTVEKEDYDREKSYFRAHMC